MKRIHFLILLPLLLALAGCRHGGGDTGRLRVAVSLPPQEQMLRAIAGDNVDVVCLMSASANPESFDPSVSTLRQVDGAALYMKAGHLAWEDEMLSKISATNPELKVVDTSAAIVPVTGTHSHHGDGDGDGHHHDDGDDGADPHTWSSWRNAALIASAMADALIGADPANADIYRANLRAFTDSMTRAEQRAREAVAPGTAFAVWHPSLSYLARDLGLEQISVGSDNKEASPARLRQAIDRAGGRGVRVLILQPGMDSRQASVLASQAGVTSIEFNPMDPDWQAQLQKVVDALSQSNGNE